MAAIKYKNFTESINALKISVNGSQARTPLHDSMEFLIEAMSDAHNLIGENGEIIPASQFVQNKRFNDEYVIRIKHSLLT